MTAAEAFAPAKINLALHVTGWRDDGYHLLDSLVVFADVGDRITVRAGRGLSLRVTGPMARGVPQDDSNLVLRAARLAGIADAHVTLDKHLPPASGIGGGSSDAAATLRALVEGFGATMPEDVLALGADVPVCLAARPARMQGIGERVSEVTGLPSLPAVLVNPGIEVSTPAVFRALARRDGTPMQEMPAFGDAAACVTWLARQRNDLETPACALEPRIGEVLAALRMQGALLARMSGSGATCFGLFATSEAARVAANGLEDRPGWWVRTALLGAPGLT